MAALHFIISIFAAVFLLLYAVYLVRTGIERRFGHLFAQYLADRKNPATAALTGAGLAIALQSSAAVALLLTGFSAAGMLSFGTGFAALLGADLGSALVVQLLSFDLSWLQPVLLVTGGWLFLKSDSRQLRLAGRIILGLALILVALHLLREAVAPLRESSFLAAISGFIAADSLTGFLVGGVLAFALHSSVAAILMVLAFVQSGTLPFASGLAMVLGANLASALIAVWLTRDMPKEARRIPVANAFVRGTLALAAVVLVDLTGAAARLEVLGPSTSLIGTHIAFNLFLVAVFVPLSGRLRAPMVRLMPAPEPDQPQADTGVLSALDQSADAPANIALSSMRQEILQMLEEVERMYRPILTLYDHAPPGSLKALRARDETVNTLYSNLRRFVAENARTRFTKRQLKDSRSLLEYAIRVEAAGDLVSKRMTELVAEKRKANASFSQEGRTELERLHVMVLSGFGLARHVLLVDDIEAARRLVLDKAEVKARERDSRKAHLKRLENGLAESIGSSDIHLETLRALRELYGHLAAVAYPILYRNGQVLETRLVPEPVPDSTATPE